MEQVEIQEGQCGLCVYFGEQSDPEPQLIQIRRQHQAPEDLVEPCRLPQFKPLDLMVTPISGCAAFEPAPEVH